MPNTGPGSKTNDFNGFLMIVSLKNNTGANQFTTSSYSAHLKLCSILQNEQQNFPKAGVTWSYALNLLFFLSECFLLFLPRPRVLHWRRFLLFRPSKCVNSHLWPINHVWYWEKRQWVQDKDGGKRVLGQKWSVNYGLKSVNVFESQWRRGGCTWTSPDPLRFSFFRFALKGSFVKVK